VGVASPLFWLRYDVGNEKISSESPWPGRADRRDKNGPQKNLCGAKDVDFWLPV
jgi:hypothetical protein